ncbi:glycosyltransferase family A protein [Sphaerisporangium sp. TRM90804]|uniref:glycosyltransferase family A protein n=1 Tax=Sphaerisporangium sp. TRM90804 TaxID=3031113 RepID=UPI00244ABB25|nr:glycosyltransferase family A protein [Sphaerisporangium sp. TRM90804]MDH2428748.1 glycosyltransferase [Sphaerisporangium sp. TRM90804]
MTPTIGVVIPTRGDRPASLREALAAVLAQRHPGGVDVVIAVDGAPPSAVAAQLTDLLQPSGAPLPSATPPVDTAQLVPDDQAAGPGFPDTALTAATRPPGTVRFPHADQAAGPRPPDTALLAGIEPPSAVPFPHADQPAGPMFTGIRSARAAMPGRVRVLGNRFSPGLPGARNTGIAALGTELVAFCDDDDVWLPGKLAAQVAALAADPAAEFAACAIEVEYGSRRVVRLAGTSRVTRRHLTRSRMVMVHSSTFLFRRGSVWPDESAPAGQNEDWDFALRAATRHPLACVDRPLVRVRWGSSHYATRWSERIAGLEWMLARHPDLADDPRGAARIYGQLAFLNAALGHRLRATRWALRAVAARWAEPRAPIALAVALGFPPGLVLGALHTRGHGI